MKSFTIQQHGLAVQGSPTVTQHVVSIESSFSLLYIKHDLFVNRGLLTSKGVIMRTEQQTKCFVPFQKLGFGDVSPYVCSYHFSSV